MHKLTAKEEEVMELMWKLGECAPKDIVAQYDEPRPHVNTVATAVQSLDGWQRQCYRANGYRRPASGQEE